MVSALVVLNVVEPWRYLINSRVLTNPFFLPLVVSPAMVIYMGEDKYESTIT